MKIKKLTLKIFVIAFFNVIVIAQSYSQQGASTNKPNASGYAPANGIKFYYEVYGEGRPIILLHGAFYTIEMN